MNLISLLESHNVEIRKYGEHHHATRNRVSIDCPKCSPRSRRFRLGLHLTSDGSHCWKCGPVDRIEILSLICRVSKHEALLISQSLGHFVQKRDEEYKRTKLEIPKGVGDLQPPHIRYLQKRGFDPNEISTTWDIQGIGISSQGLQWRLFIPVFDRLGEMVSWTTRSIGSDAKMKYRSASPEQELVSHKSVLYGSHLASLAIVIVEGPLDAWAVGPGAAATLGLSHTRDQLCEMSKYPVRAVCFDSDKEAQKRAEKLCQSLSCFPGQTERIQLETGKDPAECDPEEIQEIRKRFLEFI